MNKLLSLFLTSTCLSLPVYAQTIKVAVATESPVKLLAVQEGFRQSFPNNSIELFTFKSPSLVPEQPIGETAGLKGARNRLQAVSEELLSSMDYLVSIESYVEYSEPLETWVDIGLVLVKSCAEPDLELIQLSAPTPFPQKYVKLAKNMSSSDRITQDGYPVTVGEAIEASIDFGKVDPKDWHREAQFGSVSRSYLLEEAVFKALHGKEFFSLRSHIGKHPDFPKPGILFQDFFPLMGDADAFAACMELLTKRYACKEVQAVVGLESRGFILGAALASRLGVGFVPVRKPGKLPGPVHSVSYEKEYGEDILCISQAALEKDQRVLVIDDLIATGGSAKAAVELVRLAGAEPVEFASILEVKGLNGRFQLGIPSFNLID